MSRWPSAWTQAYLQHESEQRFARVEAVMEQRRRDYEHNKPLPSPVVDHDRGDEDGGEA